VSLITLEYLTERLELADQLLAGRNRMLTPQDLPGCYGRVVRAVDHLLHILQCPSVVAGGWAVWRHGFVGRVTQDIGIVLPADRIDEFVQRGRVESFARVFAACDREALALLRGLLGPGGETQKAE